MTLSRRCRDILLSTPEPGEAYRRCLAEIAAEGAAADYALTETIAYGTEVRYAIGVLTNGPPERFWNFGDLRGDAEARLWPHLDALGELRVAFVGSGPYPVTALLLGRRYPRAEITCIDNNIAAHLLGEAVVKRTGMPIRSELAAADEVDYGRFNAVILAAMVGGKLELAKKILGESGALVVLRGTVELRHPRLIQLESGFRDDGALAGANGSAAR